MTNSSDNICPVIQSEQGNSVSDNTGSQMDANQAQIIHEFDRAVLMCNTGEHTDTGDCDNLMDWNEVQVIADLITVETTGNSYLDLNTTNEDQLVALINAYAATFRTDQCCDYGDFSTPIASQSFTYQSNYQEISIQVIAENGVINSMTYISQTNEVMVIQLQD